jgi:ribonuclease HI
MTQVSIYTDASFHDVEPEPVVGFACKISNESSGETIGTFCEADSVPNCRTSQHAELIAIKNSLLWFDHLDPVSSPVIVDVYNDCVDVIEQIHRPEEFETRPIVDQIRSEFDDYYNVRVFCTSRDEVNDVHMRALKEARRVVHAGGIC